MVALFHDGRVVGCRVRSEANYSLEVVITDKNKSRVRKGDVTSVVEVSGDVATVVAGDVATVVALLSLVEGSGLCGGLTCGAGREDASSCTV